MKQPKPFFRKFNSTWYVQIGKRQINLGRDKDAAFQKYHELMSQRGSLDRTLTLVAEVFDHYLQWLQDNRSPSTYSKTAHYLNVFMKELGTSFQIAKFGGMHVTRWIESRRDWTDTTKNDAATLIQRAFRWAAKRGYILCSPVEDVEGKPRKQRRETVFTPEQWAQIRAEVTDQQFGDLLDFLWATGCRPQEGRLLEARHVDLANGMAIFPPSEAKGGHNERVLFLPDSAVEICRRLSEQHPSGPIFLNKIDRPWTKDAMKCRFSRLQKKLGFPMCAYAIRHAYATEGLKKGIDSLILAQIMGHSDTSMLSRHYAHLARNPVYLRTVVEKINKS